MGRRDRGEGGEILEGSPAVGTDWEMARVLFIVGHFQGEGIGHLDEAGEFLEGDGAVGVHESIITDFHEAGGEHVL